MVYASNGLFSTIKKNEANLLSGKCVVNNWDDCTKRLKVLLGRQMSCFISLKVLIYYIGKWSHACVWHMKVEDEDLRDQSCWLMEAMDEHAQHRMPYGIVLMDHGDILFLMTYS